MANENVEVRKLHSEVLVMMPAGTQLSGNVMTLPSGERYMVGPAVYRIHPIPDENKPHSALGPALAEAPAWRTDYVRPDEWPEGVDVDAAVLAGFSQPFKIESIQ